jgi:hypothetical protein
LDKEKIGSKRINFNAPNKNIGGLKLISNDFFGNKKASEISEAFLFS